MAYIDPSPNGLMPPKLALAGEPRRKPAAAAPAVTGNGQRLESLALAAIGCIFAGLVFALAIVTIANLGIALVVTALTLLPIASLLLAPSGIGR